ncbi:MAG: L-threonylcarbamoyladenylate synthase [Acidobacteriota bacterium]
MQTLRLKIDPRQLDTPAARATLAEAAAILRRGGLVALPTETVYGLGANALDGEAVARIFAAKQRPAWDPIIVHVAGRVLENAMVAALVREVPERARKLMEAFWPGPLTLLLPRSAAVPDAVTAGRPLVGVRMPSHPVAFALIEAAGVPVAAPSANLFSRISPTTAEHVLEDLDGRIDAVLDAGPTEHGVESTVIDPNQSPMVVYRPGAITLEQIHAVAGDAVLFESAKALDAAPREALPSPGVGLRHYAPRARLILVDGSPAEMQRHIARAATDDLGEDLRLGVMLPAGWQAPAHAAVFEWGRWSAPEELAQRLYAGLRELDARRCDVILCPVPGAEGMGAALRDRLRKAAVTVGAEDDS